VGWVLNLGKDGKWFVGMSSCMCTTGAGDMCIVDYVYSGDGRDIALKADELCLLFFWWEAIAGSEALVVSCSES
jgi:hypothetical protein